MCVLCGKVPIHSCVPSGFGLRAGPEVTTSFISSCHPHSVLTAITLVGNGARDGGAEARAGCEQGLLLC